MMMALERPLKEGSVRTYQAKVGLGFTDILASEVDGDVDTIYAAWNGTLGGDLTGTLPNPTLRAGATLAGRGATANTSLAVTLTGTNVVLIEVSPTLVASRPVLVVGALRMRITKITAAVSGGNFICRVYVGGAAVDDGTLVASYFTSFVYPTNGLQVELWVPILASYTPAASGATRFKLVGASGNVTDYTIVAGPVPLFEQWQFT
jgi:hypothetical protein